MLQLQSPPFLHIPILAVRSIGTRDSSKLRLPLVSIRQQLLLVVQQFLAGLGGILCVGTLDNGVYGARLLAETCGEDHEYVSGN